MWNPVVILVLCLCSLTYAVPLGLKKNMPVVEEEEEPMLMLATDEETRPEDMISRLNLPSNATSIRADITDGFSCDNKSYGYYADVENECQIFHVCLPVTYADGKENTFRWSFICPEETVFSQDSFTCMRPEDMSIDCGESFKYYELNRNFGIIDSEDEDLNMEEMSKQPSTENHEEDSNETVVATPARKQSNNVSNSNRRTSQTKRVTVESIRRRVQPVRNIPQAPVPVITAKPVEDEAPMFEQEAERTTVKYQRFNKRPSTVIKEQPKPEVAKPEQQFVRQELFTQKRKRPQIFSATRLDTAVQSESDAPLKTEVVVEPKPDQAEAQASEIAEVSIKPQVEKVAEPEPIEAERSEPLAIKEKEPVLVSTPLEVEESSDLKLEIAPIPENTPSRAEVVEIPIQRIDEPLIAEVPTFVAPIPEEPILVASVMEPMISEEEKLLNEESLAEETMQAELTKTLEEVQQQEAEKNVIELPAEPEQPIQAEKVLLEAIPEPEINEPEVAKAAELPAEPEVPASEPVKALETVIEPEVPVAEPEVLLKVETPIAEPEAEVPAPEPEVPLRFEAPVPEIPTIIETAIAEPQPEPQPELPAPVPEAESPAAEPEQALEAQVPVAEPEILLKVETPIEVPIETDVPAPLPELPLRIEAPAPLPEMPIVVESPVPVPEVPVIVEAPAAEPEPQPEVPLEAEVPTANLEVTKTAEMPSVAEGTVVKLAETPAEAELPSEPMSVLMPEPQMPVEAEQSEAQLEKSSEVQSEGEALQSGEQMEVEPQPSAEEDVPPSGPEAEDAQSLILDFISSLVNSENSNFEEQSAGVDEVQSESVPEPAVAEAEEVPVEAQAEEAQPNPMYMPMMQNNDEMYQIPVQIIETPEPELPMPAPVVPEASLPLSVDDVVELVKESLDTPAEKANLVEQPSADQPEPQPDSEEVKPIYHRYFELGSNLLKYEALTASDEDEPTVVSAANDDSMAQEEPQQVANTVELSPIPELPKASEQPSEPEQLASEPELALPKAEALPAEVLTPEVLPSEVLPVDRLSMSRSMNRFKMDPRKRRFLFRSDAS